MITAQSTINAINNASNSGNKFSSWFDNLLTGQRDYDRQVSLQQAANDFNKSEAQVQRDFEERLSNTSYQRAVADMRKAGLNPALMYGSASGASTPSGAVAHASTPSAGVSGAGFASLIGTVGQLILGGFRLGASASAARTPSYSQYVNKYGEIVGTTVHGRF